MIVDRLGYRSLAAATTIKNGPAGLFSVTCTVAGSVIIYDALSATGTILFSKTMTLGEIAHWGGTGIAANTGLHVVPAGGGTFVVCYT